MEGNRGCAHLGTVPHVSCAMWLVALGGHGHRCRCQAAISLVILPLMSGLALSRTISCESFPSTAFQSEPMSQAHLARVEFPRPLGDLKSKIFPRVPLCPTSWSDKRRNFHSRVALACSSCLLDRQAPHSVQCERCGCAQRASGFPVLLGREAGSPPHRARGPPRPALRRCGARW